MENTWWEGRGWYDLKFRAPRWWPPPVSVKDWSSGPDEQVLVVYWRIWVLMGSHKLSSFVCRWDGSYPTIPNWSKWDSAWATHGVSVEAYAWKTCTRMRWALIVSLTALWTVATRGALLARVCRGVRLLPLQCLNWLKSLRYPRIWVTLAHYSHLVVILLS
jgi:hypothetical protein